MSSHAPVLVLLPISGLMSTLPDFCDCQSPGSITNWILCRNDGAG